MKKKLILVAAPPACGKTYVSELLAKALKNTVYLDGSYIELPILSICDSEDREQK